MKIVNTAAGSNSPARAFLAGAAVVAGCALASAQQASPEVAAPTPIRSVDGKLIDTEYWSIPTVADIDGDGRQDLIVGQFMNHKAPWLRKLDQGGSGSSGTARWYRNEAASQALPVFAAGVDLACDGGHLYAANW